MIMIIIIIILTIIIVILLLLIIISAILIIIIKIIYLKTRKRKIQLAVRKCHLKSAKIIDNDKIFKKNVVKILTLKMTF